MTEDVEVLALACCVSVTHVGWTSMQEQNVLTTEATAVSRLDNRLSSLGVRVAALVVVGAFVVVADLLEDVDRLKDVVLTLLDDDELDEMDLALLVVLRPG